MTTATVDDYLNLATGRQYEATFQFELLDDTLAHVGWVNPVAGEGVVSISNDTDQRIQRALTGFELPPSEGEDFEEIRARVRPRMTLPSGDFGLLGTFLFVDAQRIRSSYGVVFDGKLNDLGVLLDQQAPVSFALPAGTLIENALRDVLERQGILYFLIDSTGTRINSTTPVAYPAGTSYKQIVDELAGLAGCLPAYFEADGRCRIRIAPDPSKDEVDVRYSDGLNIYDSGIAEWNDLLTAPNLFIVIESGFGSTDIVGTYALPDSAPNSTFQTGRVIPKVISEQGLESTVAANERARLAAVTDGTVIENVAFDGPPDWRHGTYDVMEFRGVRYLERSWTMTLEVGAPMHHQANRIFG